MPGEVRARVAWKRVKKEMGMRCSFPRDAERGTVLARPPPRGVPRQGLPRVVPRQGLPRVVHGTPPQVLVSGSAVGPELTLGRTVSPSSAVELRAGRRPGRKRSRPVRDTAARGSAQTRPSVSRAPRPHAGDPEALPVLLPSWAAGILSQALRRRTTLPLAAPHRSAPASRGESTWALASPRCRRLRSAAGAPCFAVAGDSLTAPESSQEINWLACPFVVPRRP